MERRVKVSSSVANAILRGTVQLSAKVHILLSNTFSPGLTSSTGAHWQTHKRSCQPFTPDNTVTLRTFYDSKIQIFSTSELVRSTLGLRTDQTPPGTLPGGQSRLNAHPPSQPKSLIIKIQGPRVEGSSQPLLIYNKKKDLVCMVLEEGNEVGYRKVCEVIRSRGVGGLKAYFVADLKTKDELVVKISEVLAEQPF